MPDEKASPSPAPQPGTQEENKVDTKVQEDAAKERAESGGYD